MTSLLVQLGGVVFNALLVIVDVRSGGVPLGVRGRIRGVTVMDLFTGVIHGVWCPSPWSPRKSIMKAAAKRVYDKVAVRAKSATEFIVLLDKRELKTPAKKVLTLPTHALASAVALEWEAQDRFIRPATMPLMKLATTTIDQVPSIRPTMEDSMMRSLESDLVCFRTDEEPTLLAKEDACFSPLITWCAKEMDLPLAVSSDLSLSHPPETMPRAAEILEEADDWELAALDQACNSSKSFVVALALCKGFIGSADAVSTARVAEQHQIDEWGEVEAGHDLDAADIAVRIGACSAFLRLLGR